MSARRTDGHDAEPRSAPATLPVGALEGSEASATAYLFLEPLLAGRTVLDLSFWPDLTTRHLRAAGASAVRSLAPAAPLSPGAPAVDVVIALHDLPAMPDLTTAAQRLEVLARALRPGGLCVVRAHDPRCPLHPPGRLTLPGETLRGLLRARFAHVHLVAQVPHVGFSFSASEAIDLAVNETLGATDALPSFHLAIASDAPVPGSVLGERLLTPFVRPLAEPTPVLAPATVAGARGDLARQLAESERERDNLRERLMSAEDERDRLREVVAGLRRDCERYLRQLSDQAAALELLGAGRR